MKPTPASCRDFPDRGRLGRFRSCGRGRRGPSEVSADLLIAWVEQIVAASTLPPLNGAVTDLAALAGDAMMQWTGQFIRGALQPADYIALYGVPWPEEKVVGPNLDRIARFLVPALAAFLFAGCGERRAASEAQSTAAPAATAWSMTRGGPALSGAAPAKVPVAPGSRGRSPPPAPSRGSRARRRRVYIGTGKGTLHCLAADSGRELWKFERRTRSPRAGDWRRQGVSGFQ